MIVEEEKKPNPIHIVPDLLEEIFIGLPLKSIIRFKTVSKQWRSILESEMFVERRMSLKKSHQKILAAYNCDCGKRPRLLPDSRSEGDEEIVFLHCNGTQQASMMTCDGFVCFPEPDCVNVLNPLTRQLRTFRSSRGTRSGNWVMGFGRDKVNGSYKVVRMCFEEEGYHVLDVECGKWRKLSRPPYKVNVGKKSVCVNGSIYWLKLGWGYFNILALNLHTREFHNVSVPDTWVTQETHLVNLEERLAIAKTRTGAEWKLEIWSMDAEEEIWSNTYSISLDCLGIKPWKTTWGTWFTPVTVSKLGNVVFCDNHKKLFKYYQETGKIHCLASDICVISPYLENLVSLRSELGYHSYLAIMTSRCRLFLRHLGASSGISKLLQRIRFGILEIVFITLVGCFLMYKQWEKNNSGMVNPA
ncbi:unnamed protein product [Arabis nemorensis]|uniref:F-box domain-containing protein n=1 Tax=Arabis nemorensis TaxID=586526 RepID=A0A565BPS0_9BRAS|nr:unnamed protein product [Arabis nemorensis]